MFTHPLPKLSVKISNCSLQTKVLDRSVIICLVSFNLLSVTSRTQNGIQAQVIYSEYYRKYLSGSEDYIPTVKACLDNVFEIEPMSIAYFDKMMLSYSYKKEFFSKADKNAYRFRIGNKDRIKGVHTVQKDPYGIIFTWTSYGNKTRTLDDLIKELQPYRSGDKFGIPLYKFSNNGKNYTFWVQQKLGYEACFVTISTVK